MPNAHRQFLEERFRAKADAFPLWKDVGLRWVDHREGSTTLEIDLDARHHNPVGVVHGGVVMGLLDTVMGFAATGALQEPRTTCATVSLSFTFLRAIREGTVRAEGKVVRRGRNILHLEGTCFAADGEVSARAIGAWAVIQEK